MENLEFNVNNTFGKLRKAIVCVPDNFYIEKPINAIEEKTFLQGISVEELKIEHQDFVKTLKEFGVEVLFLPAKKELPEQMFTRDIGFVVGNKLCVCHSGVDVRAKECEVLNKFIGKNVNKYVFKNDIEGGDFFVLGKIVFLGQSQRTGEKALAEMREFLGDEYTVYPIKLKKDILHLDTCFNILRENLALVCPDAIESGYEYIKSCFKKLIKVDLDEQEKMATNVLFLDEKNLISENTNVKLNKKLVKEGFNIIELEYDELVKLGGAFRCSLLDIVRD